MPKLFWLGKNIKTRKGLKIGVSPLEYLILAHLRRRELLNKKKLGQYGNELIGELNDLFAGSWEAQSGTIYPLLYKMDKTKEIISGEMKKTPLGPKKKVYTLTENGRELIDQIVRENYESDELFINNYMSFLEPFKERIKEMIEEEADLAEEMATESEVETEHQKICPTCGMQSPENAKFCAECGNPYKIDE